MSSNRKPIILTLLAIISFSFFIPLLFYMFAGLSARMNGDDYCYAAMQTTHGFWGVQSYAYQYIGEMYNGNRYSLNLALALSGLFPPKIYGITPTLAIILWIWALVFTFSKIEKGVNRQFNILAKLLFGIIPVFFTLYISWDVTQILFWFSGMAPYLLPIILNIFLLGLLLKSLSENSLFLTLLIIFTALLAGGFSETTAIVQFAWIFWLILIMLLGNYPKDIKRNMPKFIPLLAAELASFIAILFLALSPANANRLSNNPHPQVFEAIRLTLGYAIDFLIVSVKSAPVPFIAAFIASVVASQLIALVNLEGFRLNIRKSVMAILLISLICFSLIAASILPSVYAQYAYPGERAMLPARFIYICTFLSLGIITGLILQKLLLGIIHKTKVEFLSFIVLIIFGLIICLYPIRATQKPLSFFNKFQKWAEFWDARDNFINKSVSNGILDIHVMVLDHIIYDVAELNESPQGIYNKCAAIYYGARTIKADLPGWDD